MKNALLAMLLLAGCVYQEHDQPSRFFTEGLSAAVNAATDDAFTAAGASAHKYGWGLSAGSASSFVRPAKFDADYRIDFHHSQRQLASFCPYTLSSRLPEYAAQNGARVLARNLVAPDRFSMTYAAGEHYDHLVVTAHENRVRIVVNES